MKLWQWILLGVAGVVMFFMVRARGRATQSSAPIILPGQGGGADFEKLVSAIQGAQQRSENILSTAIAASREEAEQNRTLVAQALGSVGEAIQVSQAQTGELLGRLGGLIGSVSEEIAGSQALTQSAFAELGKQTTDFQKTLAELINANAVQSRNLLQQSLEAQAVQAEETRNVLIDTSREFRSSLSGLFEGAVARFSEQSQVQQELFEKALAGTQSAFTAATSQINANIDKLVAGFQGIQSSLNSRAAVVGGGGFTIGPPSRGTPSPPTPKATPINRIAVYGTGGKPFTANLVPGTLNGVITGPGGATVGTLENGTARDMSGNIIGRVSVAAGGKVFFRPADGGALLYGKAYTV